MGIYDRDYYREDSRRWWAAGGNRGTVALIAITVVGMLAFHLAVEVPPVNARFDPDDPTAFAPPVYYLQQFASFHYPSVLQGQVWRFVTSFFITPFSFFSVVFGMLGLYWFGGEMETLYGTRRFVTFYVMAGVLGNVAKFGMALAGVGQETVTFGISGPLFATFVLYAFHYPHRHIRIWIVLPIPAWALVVLYLGLDLLLLANTIRMPGGAGVPYAIDPLIGAFVGFAYNRTGGRLFAMFDGLGNLFKRWSSDRRSSPSLRVYDAPRPAAVSASHTDDEPPTVPVVKRPAPQESVDEYLEAKLDAVLEKVAKHGKGSLTSDENAILMRASEVFKKRRG